MISMMFLEVLLIIEVVWSELASKVGKITKFGQNFEGVPVPVQGCTGTPHQRPKCTGTRSGCTGTPCSGFPVSTSFCILTITCTFLI